MSSYIWPYEAALVNERNSTCLVVMGGLVTLFWSVWGLPNFDIVLIFIIRHAAVDVAQEHE